MTTIFRSFASAALVCLLAVACGQPIESIQPEESVAPLRSVRQAVQGEPPSNGDLFGNLLVNHEFRYWSDRETENDKFWRYFAPTSGDSGTYEGTGGLRVETADHWFAKVWGLHGSGTVTRASKDEEELALLPGS